MTNETKQATWTPGPWRLCAHLAETDKDCPCGFQGNIWGADEETTVAFMGLCHPHSSLSDEGFDCTAYVIADEATRLANARLIAEAPALAEALERLLKQLETAVHIPLDSETPARQVLARVRGSDDR